MVILETIIVTSGIFDIFIVNDDMIYFYKKKSCNKKTILNF